MITWNHVKNGITALATYKGWTLYHYLIPPELFMATLPPVNGLPSLPVLRASTEQELVQLIDSRS